MRPALLFLSVGLLSGCGSLANLTWGPEPFGGVRTDWSGKGITADQPLSFVVDILFLPITIPAELVRVITGWPPRGSEPVLFHVEALRLPRPVPSDPARHEALLEQAEEQRRLLKLSGFPAGIEVFDDHVLVSTSHRHGVPAETLKRIRELRGEGGGIPCARARLRLERPLMRRFEGAHAAVVDCGATPETRERAWRELDLLEDRLAQEGFPTLHYESQNTLRLVCWVALEGADATLEGIRGLKLDDGRQPFKDASRK